MSSPLRYPGGKQKLSPFVEEILRVNNLIGSDYVEPYAGGAGVAMELLINNRVDTVHLNDSNRAVYTFWKSIRDESDAFLSRLHTVSLSVDEWKRQKAIYSRPMEVSCLELGFSFFYLNRCNRSGILNAGPIGGHAQSGKWKIDARFSRRELSRRIEAIADLGHRIKLRNWDAEKFVQSYILNLATDFLVYFDPPYYTKADRLYTNHYTTEDHSRIAGMIGKLKFNWLVSYDFHPVIAKLYKPSQYFTYELQYNASTARKGKEVFYFAPQLKIPSQSVVDCVDTGLQKASVRRRLKSKLANVPN